MFNLNIRVHWFAFQVVQQRSMMDHWFHTRAVKLDDMVTDFLSTRKTQLARSKKIEYPKGNPGTVP